MDPARILVGTWEGEQEYLRDRAENPRRTLVIASVSEVDGKWVAVGRFGTPGGPIGPVKIDVEANGRDLGLRWKGASGAEYLPNLMQERHLVGKVVITTGQQKSTTGNRERSLKLEKIQ